MTRLEYEKARRLLMRRDPVLGAAIKTIGPCGLAERQRKDHLTALVGAVVSQQLSTKAAATIFGRFVALFPDNAITNAAAIAGLDDAVLRGVGLSRQKVSYLRDLCARVGDGRLQLDELEMLPDEEVIERLTRVKGFGRWTAEMFLMFRLHRPDVLPIRGSRDRQCRAASLSFAQAAGLQAARQARGSLAALPIGRVLVSLANTTQFT